MALTRIPSSLVANTFTANTILFANTLGYLSNTSNFKYFSGNNTISVGTVVAGGVDVINFAQAAFNAANASGSSTYVQAAYNQANTATGIAQAAFNSANNVAPQVQPAFDKANSANVLAQAAYNTANNALANTGSLITVNSASQLYVSNTTASISNTTGALVVNGGVGITGNLFMSAANNYGGINSLSYKLGWSDNYFARSPQFNGVYYNGNFLSIQSGNLYIENGSTLVTRSTIVNDSGSWQVKIGSQSQLNVQNTLVSTSNTTGALVVSGGVGIGGDLNASNGTFTTITGQTEVLKGTGQNLVTNSSTLTTTWNNNNTSVTTGQTDPLGGTGAILLNSGTANASHYYNQLVTSTVAQIYTLSVYVKAGTANYAGIAGYTNTFFGAGFNLTTGAFSSNISNAPISYSSTNVGNGWWRISIVYNGTTGGNYLNIFISEDGTNWNFTGTSKTIYAAAPQFEVGNLISPYTVTTSAAIYGTPTLSFSGVAGLSLASNGSLYVSPAGTASTNVTSNLTVMSAASSTSNTTGALVVSGGVGITGNVFLSSANNFSSTSKNDSYRLGWTDNYFFKSPFYNGVYFNGTFLAMQGGPFYTDITFPIYVRSYLANDTGNNVVLFGGTTPVSIQNTTTSTSNTTGALIVSGGLGVSGNISLSSGLYVNSSQVIAANGVWVGANTNLVGPTGPQGPTGATGATGATGSSGSTPTVRFTTYQFVSTNNQTIFTGVDSLGQTLSYNVNAILVTLNGATLKQTDDYTATDGTTLTLTSGTDANDNLGIVSFQAFNITPNQNTLTSYYYTASNNQTSFGGADLYGKALSYEKNNLLVYLNGLRLFNGTDYAAANGTYITLVAGASANDEVTIDALSAFQIPSGANTVSNYYYTSTAAQTTFSGADIYGNSLNYSVGNLIVTRNGSTLRNSLDYSALNGSSVVLTNATAANDEIGVLTFTSFNTAANSYTQAQSNNLFYTKAQANTAFASTGKAIAMAIVFGG